VVVVGIGDGAILRLESNMKTAAATNRTGQDRGSRGSRGLRPVSESDPLAAHREDDGAAIGPGGRKLRGAEGRIPASRTPDYSAIPRIMAPTFSAARFEEVARGAGTVATLSPTRSAMTDGVARVVLGDSLPPCPEVRPPTSAAFV